ncbi:MAG TPA: PD-(D/E)XK nuclease family protein [Methanocorpusculum sp.]|nr:PD-(D/E)XK nuclease family protein [Methanocorpusculum sp.]
MTEDLRNAVHAFEELHKTDPLTSWLFLENSETVKAAAALLTTPVLADHITTLKNFAQHLVQNECRDTNLVTLDEQLILFSKAVKQSPWGKDARTGKEKPVPLTFINELIGRYNFFKLQKIDLANYQDKSPKHKTLHTIFQTYEENLSKNNLDFCGILIKALEILKKDNPVQKAVIYHITPANPVLQDLLDSIRGYPDSEKTLPHENITEFPAPEYSIEKPPVPGAVLRYRTAQEEAEAVLDAIARLLETETENEKIKPKDILILHPGSSATAEYIYQVLPDFYYRDPEEGRRLKNLRIKPQTAYTLSSLPSIQCVMAVLSAAENDFGLEDLQTIVSSVYFTDSHWKHTFEENETAFTLRLTPGLFSQLSVVAGVHGKKAEWEKVPRKLTVTKTDDAGNTETTTWDYGRFDAFIKPFPAKDGSETNLLASLIAWIEKAAPGHSPAENRRPEKTYREWSRALKTWLDCAGWTVERTHPLDSRAQKSFLAYLDTISGPLTGNENEKCTFTEFVRHIRHFVTRKEVSMPLENPEECIRIAKIRSAADLTAKYVFIVGLTADTIPNIMRTLSPFTVEETYELCPELKANQMKQEQKNFAAALHCASDCLRLSCFAYSGAKNTVPSPFLTQIDEVKDAGKVEIKHSRRHDQITAGKILAGIEEGACENLVGLTEEESVVQRAEVEALGAYNPDFSSEEVQRQFGLVDTAKAISPTQLETYLQCPYKWYLKYHLKLYDPGEAMSENSLKGLLIHRAVERFIKNNTENYLAAADPDDAYKELMKIVEEEFASRYIDSPSWDAIKKGYMEEFDGRKNVFYRLLTEELIARAKEGWKTGPDLVEKNLDTEIVYGERKMRIKGKIDCVMQNGCDVCIIDYKTGISFADKKERKKGDRWVAKDDKIQIPLYLAAYCTQESTSKTGLLNPTDGYYLVMQTDRFEKALIINTDREAPEYKTKFEEKMSVDLEKAFDARDAMMTGQCGLPEKVCEDHYCPYARFCRAERKAEW